MPIVATTAETPMPIMIDCTATIAAPRGFFSPIRRATVAVVAIESPMATANTSVSMDSVSPTVVMASEPRRDTQNTSTMPNSDSMIISRIMGIANRKMARFRFPSV